MSVEDDKPHSEELQDGAWVESIAKARAPSSANVRAHRVPSMVKEIHDYEKYYVPKVVSIGPYHFGNKKLELVQNLKPIFTMKLLLNDKETLKFLYDKLGEPNMVQQLRNFYEEGSTGRFSDKLFTRIMLIDACFILYYIRNIFGVKYDDCEELQSHQIVYVYHDLFLLENQVPFKVLQEVMNVLPQECVKIEEFISGNILSCERINKKWFDLNNIDHLLHLLHCSLTKRGEDPNRKLEPPIKYTFRNVNELADVGIQFKKSVTNSLSHIEFFRSSWWRFSASVKIPSITVDDSTKPMLLNLLAFEMCSHNAHGSWVTSYICFLDSLIDHPEDVKTLRKAGVLDTLESDDDVTKLFNDIGIDLVPNNLAYVEAKNKIQKHYESWRNTSFSQFKHEYVKSPWSFVALLGALLALALSGVQTYYTIWSPKGECDDLCMFLKMNHHL